MNLLARKLQRYVPLSDADRIWLAEALGPARIIPARSDIIREGDDPKGVNVVVEGWACRYRQLRDGRRQIVSILLPGDLCDPHIFLLDRMDHTLGTITPVTLSQISGRALQDLSARSPVLDEAMIREGLATVAIQREWTVSLGRRSAIERIAHLFCELHARLEAVGLADATGCPFPLIQADLADALGQTPVHVNRSLKELRGTGLISLSKRQLTVHDRAGLDEFAEFDPTYLHLTVKAARA